MKTLRKLFVVTLVGAGLSACATNQALNVKAQPTDLAGYWSANGGGHRINWFVRPDGTGVHCEVTSMQLGVAPLVVDLSIAGNKAYLNNTYTLTRTGQDSFDAKTWGGMFTLHFTRVAHAPAACKQYF